MGDWDVGPEEGWRDGACDGLLVISVLDSVNVYDTDPNLKLKGEGGQCVLEMIDMAT